MKKVTNLVTLAFAGVLFAFGTTAVAQESLTSVSTQGVFSTDVDDFIDVNGWVNVQPEKAFVFADFYSDKLSAGFAKQFKNFYFGTYFEGAFAGIKSYKDDDIEYVSFGTSTDEISKTEIRDYLGDALGDVKTSSFNFATLFGFGNMAFKFDLDYTPKTFWLKTDDYEYKQDEYSIAPTLSWGLNSSVKDKEFDIHASVGAEFNPWVTDDNGTKTKQSAPNNLIFGVGFSYDFDDEGPVTQTVGLDLYDDIYIYVDKKSDADNFNDNVFGIHPSYSLKYEVEESRFAAGLDLGLPIYFIGASDDDADYKTVTFVVVPQIAGAIEYQIVKNKLRFNSGISLDLGDLTITGDDFDGDKSTKFSVFDTYSLDMSAGLTWNITEHVSIDSTMNIFTTDAENRYGASLSDIWNNSFGIQAVVKF